MYCELENVRRVLRSLNSLTDNTLQKINFSDAHDLPRAYAENTGDGKLLKVTNINSSYAGHEFWKFKFSSPTAFILYRGETEYVPDGTGVTSASFTSTSGIITVASAEWVGTPAIGDQFKFRTTSVMSDDDAEEFIDDADEVINVMLSGEISTSYLPFDDPPAIITKASTYYAAYLIFQAVFSNLNPENTPAIVRKWEAFAKDLIAMFLAGNTSLTYKSAQYRPRFVTRDVLFDKLGVPEAAGVEGLDGEIETHSVEYDKNFNIRES